MDKRAQYLQAIHAAYPDLHIQSAEIQAGGQYNDILVVNGDTIFRFPRYAAALDMLARETAVLRHIQGHLPLPIPNPIYTSLDRCEVGQAFTGYRLIPGEPISIYELEGRYDSATCQHVADQLAAFLRALHAIPTEGLSAERDERTSWSDLYARVQEKLFALISPSARDEVRQHFEPYLSDPHNFDYSRVVIHGDFGTGDTLQRINPRSFSLADAFELLAGCPPELLHYCGDT